MIAEMPNHGAQALGTCDFPVVAVCVSMHARVGVVSDGAL